MGPSDFNGLPQPGLVVAECIGCTRDLPQVVGLLDDRGRWIQLGGQLVESTSCPLDVVV
ncbi:hypothetical protein [Ornithinimicrobium faecis]|uniref:Uncharacterized protein n=1 Tax=Ornithinimicrobium faecis TaxID=2934158 RepID=A0ABY4YXL9_9MICO|nr:MULTISPECIES: hypothetical protein [unclassified Ornithinimicrobium]USQ81534.1 hypothetical protein NF556_07765 [Ornithinimicrobium sp. HY1793]